MYKYYIPATNITTSPCDYALAPDEASTDDVTLYVTVAASSSQSLVSKSSSDYALPPDEASADDVTV